MALFVLSSKDGWVNIMYTGLDAVGVDQQPIENYNEWRLLFFISFLLLVAFFVLNMFVGVVVENFHRCRAQQDREERARRAEKRARKLEKRRKSTFAFLRYFYAYYGAITPLDDDDDDDGDPGADAEGTSGSSTQHLSHAFAADLTAARDDEEHEGNASRPVSSHLTPLHELSPSAARQVLTLARLVLPGLRLQQHEHVQARGHGDGDEDGDIVTPEEECLSVNSLWNGGIASEHELLEIERRARLRYLHRLHLLLSPRDVGARGTAFLSLDSYESPACMHVHLPRSLACCLTPSPDLLRGGRFVDSFLCYSLLSFPRFCCLAADYLLASSLRMS